jgi:hypothetical protein
MWAQLLDGSQVVVSQCEAVYVGPGGQRRVLAVADGLVQVACIAFLRMPRLECSHTLAAAGCDRFTGGAAPPRAMVDMVCTPGSRGGCTRALGEYDRAAPALTRRSVRRGRWWRSQPEVGRGRRRSQPNTGTCKVRFVGYISIARGCTYGQRWRAVRKAGGGGYGGGGVGWTRWRRSLSPAALGRQARGVMVGFVRPWSCDEIGLDSVPCSPNAESRMQSYHP